MANAEVKDNVVEMESKGEPEQEKDPKDQKTEEPKKEFFLIRGAKAVWSGAKKTGKAINGFVHKHPYVTAGISTAVGYVIKIGVDLLSGSSEEVNQESQTLELPEGTDNYVEPEDDSISIEFPEIETTTEE